MVFIYHRWKRPFILEKTGKDAFSKMKNQLKESQKDEIEFLWKHFEDGKAMSYPTKTDARKGFSLSLLKDVCHKDLQQNLKHSMVLKFNAKVKTSIYLVPGFMTVGIFP